MESGNIGLRKATTNDLQDVLSLIHQLAVFEKEPEAVELTLDDLIQHFSENRFEVFLAEVSGVTVGMALFYERYSTWKGPFIHLEDLFVLPEFRGRGIGRMLLEWVVFESKRRGARRLGWEVLDWNDVAVEFYKSIGARIEKQWWQCRMCQEEIESFSYRFENRFKEIEP